ncbi:MAG: hypothetical protein EA350_06985 [Gemmatimonadales bacterium]|nr:MAG: hypothetical protein EA350_06985 [Gemmatimonadales bacterium]
MEAMEAMETPEDMRQTPERHHRLSQHPAVGLALLAGLAIASAFTPTPAAAQPLVQDVVFEGNEHVSSSALQDWIVTEPTRCRALFMYPFCLFTDADLFTERHRLDIEELPRDELRLLVVYFREGFRRARVTSEVRDTDDGVDVHFRIEEGPPTVLESRTIRQSEPVFSDAALAVMGFPEEGLPLNLGSLDEALVTLREEFEEVGYLDAVVSDSIEVSSEGDRAVLVVDVEVGPRATVERFEVVGRDRVEERTIVMALHMEEGDVITAPRIRRSRTALYQSNLFHEAQVSVAEQPDSAKVVRVQVREAPPRLGRVGVGVSTLEFGQVEGRFSHYNWYGGGRRLDLRSSVGNLMAGQLTDFGPFHDILPGEFADVDESPFRRPTWQLSAEIQQPAFRAADNLVSFGVFSHRRIIPGVSVDEGVGADASVIRGLAWRTHASLGYRYEVTSVSAGDVFFCVNHGICETAAIEPLRGTHSLSPVTLGFHMDRSDDALGPTDGYRLRVDFEHASANTRSDYRYNRVSGDASWYRPVLGPPRHVVAAQVRAGWVRPDGSTRDALGIEGSDAALLHPRKRFFSGGARSVRGFIENNLGPRILTVPRQDLLGEEEDEEAERCGPGEIADGSCDPAVAPVEAFSPRPLGGTSVLQGNLEYRIPLGMATLALFLDGAIVGSGSDWLSDASSALTPGIGARFPSPAGPIRIDIGVRPGRAEFLPVITETVASEETGRRELLRLDQPRFYDPLEDAGRVGRILGRLVLHFSIGEAF